MRMTQILRAGGTLLFTVLCIASTAVSQTGTATISGLVTDQSGALVVKAELELRSTDKGSVTTTTTNDTGIYVFTGIQPGQYQITIRKPGFKQVDFLGLVLNTQDHVEQNFRLQLGSVSESVTVSGNDEHMETDNPAVGLLVNRDFVENTPLNGRSFQDLIALAPGAVSSASTNGTFSIDGQRDDTNNFTVDGVAANLSATSSSSGVTTQQMAGAYPSQTAIGTTQSLLSVDAMQEFRIQTSGYTAEYGRTPGGQIEITSRSGTNDYHGTAFDYFRNTVLDANNWFANQLGDPRQAERQNDFGGTLGGPVVVPGIYNGTNKTFFFFSYEGLRLNVPGFFSDFHEPTLAFRQSAAPGVAPFLDALPIPNGAIDSDGITALWSGGYSSPKSLDSWGLRVDQALGNKHKLFLRVANTSSYANLIGNVTSDTLLTATAGATLSISPTLVDELRFNYSRSIGKALTVPYSLGGGTPLPTDLTVPAQYASLPGGFISGFTISAPNTSLYDSFDTYSYPFTQSQYNIVDSLSWTKGRHTLKTGIDYRRLTPVAGNSQYFSFISILSVASIQEGQADSFFLATGVTATPVFHELSLYVQDHWQVAPHLTLDYGLRWEFDPAPGGASGGIYPPALTSSNLATAQLAPAGTPLYHTTYTNFAPRIGFAWQPGLSQSHPIALRVGAGIFYDTGQTLGALAYSSVSPPFGAYAPLLTDVPMPIPANDINPPPLSSAQAELVPPYSFLQGLSDPNLKLPYTASWNVSLDFGLRPKNTLTTSYVGNVGERLLFLAYGLPNNPEFPAANYDLIARNLASSSYNGLQVVDHGYLTSGLQFEGSYTWAHALDNASSDYSVYSLQAPIRGNSDNDIRQSLNAALTYETPNSESGKFVGVLTHGWLIANRFTAITGYPINVIQGYYYTPDGKQIPIYPDLVPGVPPYLHNVPGVLGGWELNPAAFSPVPLNPDGTPTSAGTLGRNLLHGPAFWTLNTAVQRTVPLGDHLRLIVRAEAFNLFNHPNPGDIDNQLFDGANFGRASQVAVLGANNESRSTQGTSVPIYASGGPRSFQLSLKLQF
jgi:hypothetical protein